MFVCLCSIASSYTYTGSERYIEGWPRSAFQGGANQRCQMSEVRGTVLFRQTCLRAIDVYVEKMQSRSFNCSNVNYSVNIIYQEFEFIWRIGHWIWYSKLYWTNTFISGCLTKLVFLSHPAINVSVTMKVHVLLVAKNQHCIVGSISYSMLVLAVTFWLS